MHTFCNSGGGVRNEIVAAEIWYMPSRKSINSAVIFFYIGKFSEMQPMLKLTIKIIMGWITEEVTFDRAQETGIKPIHSGKISQAFVASISTESGGKLKLPTRGKN